MICVASATKCFKPMNFAILLIKQQQPYRRQQLNRTEAKSEKKTKKMELFLRRLIAIVKVLALSCCENYKCKDG